MERLPDTTTAAGTIVILYGLTVKLREPGGPLPTATVTYSGGTVVDPIFGKLRKRK